MSKAVAEVQVVLRAHPRTAFRRLFQVFSDIMGVDLAHVKFMGRTGRLDAGTFGLVAHSSSCLKVHHADSLSVPLQGHWIAVILRLPSWCYR
jgi:hypothetical protein